MERLVEAIETTPIIDHHAHNLLTPSNIGAHDLLSITSEANGPALKQGAPSTLAHLRAVHQLAKILDCDPTWDAVQTAIEQKRTEPDDAWARQCFHGIETVLIDDGLNPANVHPYEWHDRLTRSKCKRIIRIERVAEKLMTDAFEEFGQLTAEQKKTHSNGVTSRFIEHIQGALSDPDVAGFKSVICYRVGLRIPEYDPRGSEPIDAMLDKGDLNGLSRLENDRLSPYFVHLTARLIERSESKKPLQFHTGLGDNDINLGLSNASHLQNFIENYPEVPIVLLHASYPFTTEAGYLASVYGNCWLDIGEVFPFLSQDGQERVIKEALDLCPSEKLTWSTDGHWFPETYLLAILQARDGMQRVLCEYVEREVLTVTEAIRIVQDIFFNTSNRLYNLGLTLDPIERTLSPKVSTKAPNKEWIVNFNQLKSFVSKHSMTRYLRLQWLDYTATPRVRVLPLKQALKMFADEKFVTVANVVLGLLQDDYLCPGFSPTDVYGLYPRFESLRLGSRAGYATLQCEFRDKDGTDIATCPRTCLRKQVERAGAHGLDFLIGFEIEVVFMSTKIVDGAIQYGGTPINDGGHAWSTARALQQDSLMDLLETIHTNLERAGIELQQFHAESSPGQYEIILDPLPPLAAVDALLAAREIISSAAANANMRATLYPKPSPLHCGTGAHLHLSVTPGDVWQDFFAGVLRHLKAIAAFTYSNDASYERVIDGVWAGSTWIAWGTQNRETPIRRVEGSHFEMKCMDGLSNPYLGLAAIMGAGVQGALDKEPLRMKDCAADPAKMSAKEREDLGITQQFPKSIDDALLCLEEDRELCDILGQPVVQNYTSVKRTEKEMLKTMDPEKRRNWLIERY